MAKAKPKISTPEEKLANHWRQRANLKWSDFDAFTGRKPPRDADVGPARMVTEVNLKNGVVTFEAAMRELCLLIWNGFPLSFFEYHLAVALHLLLADGIPYEDFYVHRWHETAASRGYGPGEPIGRGDERAGRAVELDAPGYKTKGA